jgi:hypothetical protein
MLRRASDNGSDPTGIYAAPTSDGNIGDSDLVRVAKKLSFVVYS